MKIRIVQHLCPMRHAITATAYKSDSGEADPEMVKMLEGLERELHVDPWCGICGSRELHFEDAITRYKSMDEARPALELMQLAQAETRKLIDNLKKTARSN